MPFTLYSALTIAFDWNQLILIYPLRFFTAQILQQKKDKKKIHLLSPCVLFFKFNINLV